MLPFFLTVLLSPDADAMDREATPLLPTPQQVHITGPRWEVPPGTPTWTGRENADPAAVRLADTLLEGLALRIRLGEAGDPAVAEVEHRIPDAAGSYWLRVQDGSITVAGRDGAGTFYALQTLRQCLQKDEARRTLPALDITDTPALPLRGVVEGFYGTPWSHADRLRQLAFYGRHRLNIYIYGPKDDPFHGFSTRWREPYPPQGAEELRELVRVARANHVRFVWAVHPGRDIRWEDADGDGRIDDIDHCLTKFEHMYSLGVRSFAVFFDDISGEGARAKMQVEMLNTLQHEFIRKKKDTRPLILCPTQYNRAWSHGDYLDRLGRSLDPDIDILWTGDSVCADVTREAADWVAARIQRAPLIWWNWPVSDYCRSRLLMGRAYGLDPHAADRIAGLVSNPMDKPEASKLGLFGVAAFTWNPTAFNSATVWQEGIRRLYPGLSEAMQCFANHHSDQGPNTHGYRREESAAFAPILTRARAEIHESGALTPATKAALHAEFGAMRSSAAEIRTHLPEQNPWLWEEVMHWVETFDALGATGVAATHLLANPSPSGVNDLLAGFRDMAAAGERERQRGLPDRWARPAVSGGTVVLPFLLWVRDHLDRHLPGLRNGLDGDARPAPRYEVRTNLKAFHPPPVTREGIYVRLDPVREVLPLQEGEWIGLSLPPGVPATYVHLKLGDTNAPLRGEVQVSVDGENWVHQPTRDQGGEMQTPLDPARGLRHMRYINCSPDPVELDLDLFKLDVPENSRANLPDAMYDGTLKTYFTFAEGESIPAPEKSTHHQVQIFSPDPGALILEREGTQGPLHSLRAQRKVPVHELRWQ